MKTTKKDFELFKREVRRWVDKFGLYDWEIVFTHTEDDGARAGYDRNDEGRSIVFNLSAEYDSLTYSTENIKVSAFHEVTEGLLLAPLDNMIDRRRYGYGERNEALHQIVRTLEHVFFNQENQ